MMVVVLLLLVVVIVVLTITAMVTAQNANGPNGRAGV
jgi:hypothetical protein